MDAGKPFYKAIETHYQGHRFRSRLEARWAVFFTMMGIEFQYEPEGYVLEGVPYLPDFYLPVLGSFVEIKATEPTEEENDKARLLALYTGKNVFIFFGSVWIPGQLNSYQAALFMSPEIYTYKQGEEFNGDSTEEVEIPRSALALLERLHEADVEVIVEYRTLSFHSKRVSLYEGVIDQSLPFYIASLSHFQETIANLSPLIKEYGDDVIKALSPKPGWQCKFFSSPGIINDFAWVECSSCGSLCIWNPFDEQSFHTHCPNEPKGNNLHDSPRLIAAYTAARSARFEHGEKP